MKIYIVSVTPESSLLLLSRQYPLPAMNPSLGLLSPKISFSCDWISYKWNHKVSILFAWLLWFNIIFSDSSALWCTSIASFFLLLSSIPVYDCTPTDLQIFLLLDLGVIFWLLWINVLWWPFLYKSFCECMHSFLLGIYPRVKLLG